MMTTANLSGAEIPKRLPIGSNNPIERNKEYYHTLAKFIRKADEQEKKAKRKRKRKVVINFLEIK